MQQIKSVTLAWLLSIVLLSSFVCKAETKVPCLIFSGNAEKEHCIDLAKLNRITFGDNSMVISYSKDENQEPVELLYSLYNNIRIGDATPHDIITGIEAIDTDSDARIFVDTPSKLLYLESSTDARFAVGVFNISGRMILSSDLRPGDAFSLASLSPGIYVAVATDGKTKLNLKFILN